MPFFTCISCNSINASELLSQAKDEQTILRDELKTILDELTYDKLVEKDANIIDTANRIQEKVPLKIFVG